MKKTEKDVKEAINHIKWATNALADMWLMLDDGLLGSQVYNKEDVMNALHLFFHVSGNYTLGEMMKQGCSMEFCEKKAEEFGTAMHELMMEYMKIDTRKYYQ